MNTSTVATLTNVLPALATLSQGVQRTARKGQRVRLYRPEGSLLESPAIQSALNILLHAGHKVSVYEADRIYTPALDNGQIVWAFRMSRKTRATVTVEVVL